MHIHVCFIKNMIRLFKKFCSSLNVIYSLPGNMPGYIDMP